MKQQEAMTGEWYRIAAAALISGAVITTVFNVLFPRAGDPSDVQDVLTTMAGNEARQQVAFLGVAVGFWVVTAGVVGIYRSLHDRAAGAWARLGFYGVLVGAALFTASVGLGLAATRSAVDWVAAGSSTTSMEYAVASALSAVDDAVWSMSIVSFWGGLGLLGIGMLLGDVFPRWLGAAILVLGFATSVLVGIPIAYGGASEFLLLFFAGLGQLTLVWALVAGIWILRRAS